MTARLTPDRLAEVRARAEAATEGTWEMFDFRGEGGGVYIKAGEDSASFYGINSGVTSPSHEQDQQMVADAALMSHARTDVPDLLAALDAATERAERAEAALERVEALAEDWEVRCEFYRGTGNFRAHRAVTDQLREAMEGKP